MNKNRVRARVWRKEKRKSPLLFAEVGVNDDRILCCHLHNKQRVVNENSCKCKCTMIPLITHQLVLSLYLGFSGEGQYSAVVKQQILTQSLARLELWLKALYYYSLAVTIIVLPYVCIY
uniref:Uncharacterized protein n=1 Tax=Glossina pallidipes TaxID=7398 RepID=A0A1B0AA06_GLOPL